MILFWFLGLASLRALSLLLMLLSTALFSADLWSMCICMCYCVVHVHCVYMPDDTQRPLSVLFYQPLLLGFIPLRKQAWKFSFSSVAIARAWFRPSPDTAFYISARDLNPGPHALSSKLSDLCTIPPGLSWHLFRLHPLSLAGLSCSLHLWPMLLGCPKIQIHE